MSETIQKAPMSASLLDIVGRASLFEILQQALRQPAPSQSLPVRLHADVGLPPAHPHAPAHGDTFS